MLTVTLKKIPQTITGLALTSVFSLGLSACFDPGPISPSASAPLTATSGQTYRKVHSDGSLLGDAAVDWACVKDEVTGLVWEYKAPADVDPNTVRGVDNVYTWASANAALNGGDAGSSSASSNCDGSLTSCDTESFVDAVNTLTLCGASDWQVPTREELSTIVDRGVGINLVYFPEHAVAQNYWTLSTNAFAVAESWSFGFTASGIQVQAEAKAVTNAVRLVRGNWATTSATDICSSGLYRAKPDAIYGEVLDAANSVIPELVTDKQTGLMWQRAVASGVNFVQAQAAADAVNGAVAFGFTGWRVPNINELSSLVDVACDVAALNASQFPLVSSSTVWSSTEDGANALLIDFTSAEELSAVKTDAHDVLLVRTAY